MQIQNYFFSGKECYKFTEVHSKVSQKTVDSEKNNTQTASFTYTTRLTIVKIARRELNNLMQTHGQHHMGHTKTYLHPVSKCINVF